MQNKNYIKMPRRWSVNILLMVLYPSMKRSKYLGHDAVLNIASEAMKDPETSTKLYKLGTTHPEYVVADVLKGITNRMP